MGDMKFFKVKTQKVIPYLLFLFFVLIVFSFVFIIGSHLTRDTKAEINCCHHECALTDPDQCQGNKVYSCSEGPNSDCDSDIYNDWCEIQDCSVTNQFCNNGVCQGTPTTCSDGTLYGTCSGTALFCNSSGNLVSDCNNCPCTGDWICSGGTTCVAPCVDSCTAGPGCRSSLTNGSVVEGTCCSGDCYDCNTGYTWNGTSCILGCSITCTSNSDCNDADSCTIDSCTDPGTCSSSCTNTSITSCIDDDGCCPSSCNDSNDNDCSSIKLINNNAIPDKLLSGDNIYFSFSVTGAELPYLLTIKSDIEGVLISSYDIYPSVVLSTIGAHVITVDVSDANGATASLVYNIDVIDASELYSPIDSFLNGKTYPEGIEVNFYTFTENGVAPYTYEWVSSIDGIFGVNDNWVSIDTLSVGVHTIELTVKDSTGNEYKDSINLTIKEGIFANISPKNESFELGDQIFFHAWTQGGSEPYTYSWISDIDGEIGTTDNFSMDTPSLGLHEITVVVTDNNGDTYTEVIYVEVKEAVCIDDDNDGYGVVDSSACVNSGIDCDDNDNAINPRQDEICGNSVDENCNGSILDCPIDFVINEPATDGLSFEQGEALHFRVKFDSDEVSRAFLKIYDLSDTFKRSIALKDDGSSGDLVANDNEYTGLRFLNLNQGDYYVEITYYVDGKNLTDDLNIRYFSVSNVSIPSSFDWRNHDGSNWMTSVKNQSSCGSCWAFASVAIQEAKYNIQENNPDLDINLSEQYLVSDCCSSGSCSGGMPSSCALTDEACYPYTRTDSVCGSRCSDWDTRLWSSSMGYVSGEDDTIKLAIMKQGPLYTSMNAEYVWDAANNYYTCSDTNTTHAVTLVGWNDVGGYWIIKNSWGLGWGDNGYANIKYDECGLTGRKFVDKVYAP